MFLFFVSVIVGLLAAPSTASPIYDIQAAMHSLARSTQVSAACAQAYEQARTNPCFQNSPLNPSFVSSGNGALILGWANMLCPAGCLAAAESLINTCSSALQSAGKDPANILRQIEHAAKLLCVADPSTGTLCFTELVDPATNAFFVDFDNLTYATQAELTQQCVQPCFAMFMRRAVMLAFPPKSVTAGTAEPTPDAMLSAYLNTACMIDHASGTYCYPYIQGTPDCVGSSTPAACATQLANYICNSTCHRRVLAAAAAFQTSLSTADVDYMVASVTHQCVVNPATGELCASLWLTQEQANTHPFDGPFPANCPAAVTAANALGCCFTSGFRAYVGLIAVSNPTRVATLAANYNAITSCSGFTAGTTPCPRHNTTASVAVVAKLSKDIVCDYCNTHASACQSALLNDFALSNGVLSSDVTGFVHSCLSSRSSSSSSSIVMSGNVNQVTASQNTLITTQAAANDWYLGNYFVVSGPYYGASAASAVTPTVAAEIALAFFLAVGLLL